MSENPSETEASATELVQAIFSVENIGDPKAQAETSKLLQEHEGLHSLSIIEGKLHVSYDPTRVTEKEIAALLAQAGHRLTDAEMHRASPLAEE